MFSAFKEIAPTSSGRCSGGEWGNSTKWFLDRRSNTRGRLACVDDLEDNQSELVWTDDKRLNLGFVIYGPINHVSAFNTWSKAAN
jgi:hypothetical protein